MLFKIGSFNQKQIIALIAIGLGIGLMIFASHGLHEAHKASSSIDKFRSFFTNATGIWNPVVKFFGGEAHEEASKYNTTLTILMVIGISMVIAGIWGFFYYKKE
jgi:hypothetical protein